jgi:hypothetical protein
MRWLCRLFHPRKRTRKPLDVQASTLTDQIAAMHSWEPSK